MMAKLDQTEDSGPRPRSSMTRQPFLTRLSCTDLIFEGGHSSKPSRVRKNTDIIIAGNRHKSIYANHDGWLFRYKILRSGCRQIVDFILPGEIFGLQACLFRSSLYSVATITDASLTAIPATTIDDVFARSPQLSKALFWSAVCEAAILGEHLTDAGRRTAYERISHLMLELFVRLSSAGLARDMSFRMPLTQELIGDALGLTTIHVNRTLRSLREDGLIAIHGKSVTIRDFDTLSLLCDFEHCYLSGSVHSLRNKTASPVGSDGCLLWG